MAKQKPRNRKKRLEDIRRTTMMGEADAEVRGNGRNRVAR